MKHDIHTPSIKANIKTNSQTNIDEARITEDAESLTHLPPRRYFAIDGASFDWSLSRYRQNMDADGRDVATNRASGAAVWKNYRHDLYAKCRRRNAPADSWAFARFLSIVAND